MRDTVREIGYTTRGYGFDCETCGVIVAIKEQSSDIAHGRRQRAGSEAGG